jgi:NADPH-dependent curcumin reductase
MLGVTTYFGMLEVASVKAGDMVIIFDTAGATGMAAGQIAKIQQH